MTKLYISGPMTGLPDENYPAFNAAAELLRAGGFEVSNPAEKGTIPDWTWNDYMKWDLPELLECQGVALLDDWWKSRGANREVDTALSVEIKVKPVQHWLDGFDDGFVPQPVNPSLAHQLIVHQFKHYYRPALIVHADGTCESRGRLEYR